MTRLPSDSFLPSGAIDSLDRSMPSFTRPIGNANNLSNSHSPSVISPLSLPRALHQQHSYFDHPVLHNRHPNYVHSPSPLGGPSSRPPAAQSKLSPPRHLNGSGVTSPLMAPLNDSNGNGATSPFDHFDPRGAAAATLLQRREEHNRRALENWQAERAHLEASRARAEEMFREERTLMDEERLIWIDQKQTLDKEIGDWRQRAEAAESEVDRLNALLRNLHSGVGRTLDGSIDATLCGLRSNSSGSSGTGSKFRSPPDGLSPGSLMPGRGMTAPESKPFVPLDPRMQSGSSGSASPSQGPEHIPSINVIDVNEIIPELEGIRLKAPAIQKHTFMDGSSGSPPPLSPDQEVSSPPPSQQPAKPLSPLEVTKEALQAPEHRRLTMHAGHTPNHSMSFSQLPTIEPTAASTVAPNTAGSSGASTPKDMQEQPSEQPPRQDASTTGADAQEPEHEEQEAVLDPSDEDPALKGPLCLRNRPAADEVFLRRLSDKLEEVKANDVRPAVLDEARSLSMPEPVRPDSNIGAQAAGYDDEVENPEPEIPLKLKNSTNFGQPLGQLGGSSNF